MSLKSLIWPTLRLGLAAVGSFLTVFALSPFWGAPVDLSILAVIVSVTLGQAEHQAGLRTRLLNTVAGFAITTGLGMGLHFLVSSSFAFLSILAVVIVGATFLGNWGRFGKDLSRVLLRSVGALLFFPAPMANHLVAVPGLILAAVGIALAWNFMASLLPDGEQTVSPPPPAASRSWTITSLRALQLGSALALTLVLGWLFLPGEVQWAFITIYLVSVSTRTRGELLVKSLFRVLGAVVGAVLGFLLVPVVPSLGAYLAVLMLGILILAAFLRQLSYAWWSAGVTLLLTLLYAVLDPASPPPIVPRILGILLGAFVAATAAFTIAPLRTRRILRGYLGRTLAELDVFLNSLMSAPEKEPQNQLFHAQARVFSEAARAAALHRLPQGWHPASAWLPVVSELERRVDELSAVSRAPTPEEKAALGVVRRNNGSLRKKLAGKDFAEPVELEGFSDGSPFREAVGELNRLLFVLWGSL